MNNLNFNITVCCSGGGGNFLSLIRSAEEYGYHILKLIVDRNCKAITIAENYNIPYKVIDKKVSENIFFEIFENSIPSETDLIVLAGFSPIIPERLCEIWQRKIINTHPSLLPKYGGKGMYGVKIQEAVMNAGEKEAGCTVHYVDSGIDTGEIILQQKIEVDYNKTPWELGGRIFEEECKLLPLAIKKLKGERRKPLVSICSLVYNHGPFICQCLEGFLIQQTDFKFEILIHDDASTDGTGNIIREYEEKYPDIIKPVYQRENQYSKGINPLTEYLFPQSTGKYIALCEGDDYWTDLNKLQKQVDFMETHPEYSLCCHRYSIYDENTGEWAPDYAAACFHDDMEGIVFDNDFNMNRSWLTKTMTVLFRKDAYCREDFSHYKNTKDVHLFYHLLKYGKGYSFNFNGAVYRRHPAGVWSGIQPKERIAANYFVRKCLYIHNKNDNTLKKTFRNYFSIYYFYMIQPILIEKKIKGSYIRKIFSFYLDDLYFFRLNYLRMQIKKVSKNILISWKNKVYN